MDKKKQSELINQILTMGVSQIQLAAFLDITRQTVATLNLGVKYVRLSKSSAMRLAWLEDKDKETVLIMLSMNEQIDNIRSSIFSKSSDYISEAATGINHLHYWITDEKFKNNLKYHRAYFGHMNNFYPRYNQFALFMRDYFMRERYPLVTFQIDHENHMITQLSIKAFDKEYHREKYDLSNYHFPITYQQLMEILKNNLFKEYKFLIWGDYLDDEWAMIMDSFKKADRPDVEIFDLSRLFNYLEHQQPHHGPLLEEVLTQFRFSFDREKLLQDSDYRGDFIIKLINLCSLKELSKRSPDNFSRIFDSHGLIRDNEFLKKERRKQKIKK